MEKKTKQNPTPKQIKTARDIAENLIADKPKTTKEILVNNGYSPGIAKNPQLVTQSIGFKKAMFDLGLTEELITTKLVEDINSKESRLGELKLGADILGMTKREEEQDKSSKGNIYNFFVNTEAQQKVRDIDAELKGILTAKKDVQED